MSTPTWISNLSDPILKADFTAFAASGAITEAEVATAFGALAMELAGRSTTLSQSQFADLQSIAQNIASLGASPYLQFVTHAFASGNAANAFYTGGGAMFGPLGNLAVGENAQWVSKLVGKWFLGSDLPADLVMTFDRNNVLQPSTFAYQTVNAPLYGASHSPVMTDISQGQISDCYLLGSLAEVANQDPSTITSMISNNGNGTYGVRFFVNGAAHYVTVNNQLGPSDVFDSNAYGAYSNIWGPLVEKAYAELQDQAVSPGGRLFFGNSFTTIGNDGFQDYALEAITGAKSITEFYSGSGGLTATSYDQSLTQTSQATGLTMAALRSTLAADLLIGDAIDLDSRTNATSGGLTTLVSAHTFAVYDYDASTGCLELYNPWGTQSATQTFKTKFEVSLATLLSDGDYLSVASNGTATAVANASVVAAPALQLMSQVKSFAVNDSIAHIAAAVSALAADTKLSALTVTGSTGGAFKSLAGLNAPTTIALSGNSESATVVNIPPAGAGLASTTLLVLSNPADMVLLGGGATTIDYTLAPASGVENFIGFNAAQDLLSIQLNGGALQQTFANGGDWLSSTTDLTHGVFLSGVTSAQSATVSNGIATVR